MRSAAIVLIFLVYFAPGTYSRADDLAHALTPQQLQVISEAHAGSVSKIDAPQTLYHWTNQDVFKNIDEKLSTGQALPLVDPMGGSNFSYHFPEFRGKRGIFSWSNPVTGMGTEHVEMYGDRVMRLKLKKDARAALLVSDVKNSYPDLASVQGKYDLVLHIEKAQGRNGQTMDRLREWIVLNPSAVESISADPELLRADVLPWFEKLSDPDFHFAENDLHFHGTIYEPGHGRDFFIKTRLNHWLKMRSSDVPASLRGEHTLEPSSLNCLRVIL